MGRGMLISNFVSLHVIFIQSECGRVFATGSVFCVCLFERRVIVIKEKM